MAWVDQLRAAENEVLAEATQALHRAHLAHYEAAGSEEARRRLGDLFSLLLRCLDDRSLAPMLTYAEGVGKERFEAGFDISEVQTAFNVLEETIWRLVIATLAADEVTDATAMIGTVLGAGKDALARTWVSLAAKRHVHSLDVSALFEGTRS